MEFGEKSASTHEASSWTWTHLSLALFLGTFLVCLGSMGGSVESKADVKRCAPGTWTGSDTSSAPYLWNKLQIKADGSFQSFTAFAVPNGNWGTPENGNWVPTSGKYPHNGSPWVGIKFSPSSGHMFEMVLRDCKVMQDKSHQVIQLDKGGRSPF